MRGCHLPPYCCLPPPAQDLTPYITQPLRSSPFVLLRCSDTSPVHLFAWILFSNCFDPDTPHQAAVPCGCHVLPAWALTSSAGQLPVCAPLLFFLSSDILCWIASYNMDTLLILLGVFPCWVPSYVDTALDHCSYFLPSVDMYLGFRTFN